MNNYLKATGFILFILFFALVPSASHAATFVSGAISANTAWTLANSPYVVQNSVYVIPGVTLTIDPGVIVKFNATMSMIVDGTLNAQGNATHKIYFTSLKDDSVGGDTNGDGTATVSARGDWDDILFDNGTLGDISYAVIRYGGWGGGYGIYNSGGTVTISNSHISYHRREGIVQDRGSLNVINSEISNNDTGFYFSSSFFSGGTATISENSIHNNSVYGVLSEAQAAIGVKNNWWGDASGPFHPALNPGGAGNQISGNVDFIPWLASDPLPQENQPSFSNLGQFKSDGATSIVESDITTENVATFKAILSDPSDGKVKLQVELRPFSEPFTSADDGGVLSSDFVSSRSQATIAKIGLANGQYHWRVRAVNMSGLSSPWQEFGITGNTDFEIKLVPLYTQVRSLFPSDEETLSWEASQYGSGNYPTCVDVSGGSTIRRCGCAITSAVMMLRYHNVVNGADNIDVNPLNINAWLNANSGYTADGSIIWPQISKYALGKIKFDGISPLKDSSTLDNYLAAGNPVILYEASVGHFLLADGKLSSTHTIRDPRWYNTRYLAQAVADSFTRNYNNDFTGLRLFSPVVNPVVSPGIYMSIASPAELLVTDPQGHRLGKDPIIGASYNEIPSGVYYQEGISAAVDNPLPPHESKVIWVPNPSSEGQYNLQVIGTGEGTYALNTLIYDIAGNTHTNAFASTTFTNNVTLYNVNFTPTQPENIQVREIFDKVPPEAIIYFDQVSKQLKVDGIDAISQTTLEQQGSAYVIKDMSGNALLLSFDILRQSDSALEIALPSLTYNSDSPLALPQTTLKFSWMLDHKTQSLKSFDQNISVDGKFEVKASYQSMKNVTIINITKGSGKNKETTRQTLPGLAIVKLFTKSGNLDFGF